MDNIQLIIPMSGIGKRFIDCGYDVPKPMIDVDGIPMIHHVINLFPGIDDISFICNENHLKETKLRSVLKSICPNCKIFSIPKGKGPVDAVSKIFNIIDDEKEVIISYCDYGTKWDFNKFIEDVRNKNADGSIACYRGFHPHMLINNSYAFCLEKKMNLIEIKEKESFTNNKMGEWASNGTYYFKSGRIVKKYFTMLMDMEMEVNGEYYVSLVYNLLVKDGLSVRIFEIENMLQWGTPYDLEVYKGWSKYFSNIKKVENNHSIDNNVTLVLPMAGRGSRFTSEGYLLPKPLIDVDGHPMVIKAVSCLPKFNKSVFICLKEHVDNFNLHDILSKYYPNTKVVSINGISNGQAHTCEIGINESGINLDDPILISACDNGATYNLEEYNDIISNVENDIVVWSFRNNQSSKMNPNMYAWLDVDENNFIKHVSCKNFIYDDPLKTHAIIGTMYFRKAKYFIEGLKKNYEENIKTNGEFYVDDVINQNIKSGLKVKVFEVENYICWGTPDDYNTYKYWKKFFNKND